MKCSCLLLIAGSLASIAFCQSQPVGVNFKSQGMKPPPVSAYFDVHDDTITAAEFQETLNQGYYEMQIKQKPDGTVDLRLTPKPFLGLLNSEFPQFEFRDLEGKTWNNQRISGHVTVFHFWNTNSKDCLRVMGYLNGFKRAHPEIIWLAPAVESPEKLKSFLKNHIFDLAVIPGQREFSRELFIEGFPIDFIVDQDGVIVEIVVGKDPEKLQSFIERYASVD
jgi:hypothetical protein